MSLKVLLIFRWSHFRFCRIWSDTATLASATIVAGARVAASVQQAVARCRETVVESLGDVSRAARDLRQRRCSQVVPLVWGPLVGTVGGVNP